MKIISNKIASVLIVTFLIVTAIPISHAEAAGDISPCFKSNILEIGKTQKISLYDADGNLLSDLSGYRFKSLNPDIATVDEVGNVTGVSIGRAKIEITGAAYAIAEIPVVGANLLKEIEATNIAWAAAKSDAEFWWLRKQMRGADGTDYMSNSNKSGSAVSRYEIKVKTMDGPVSDADRVLRLTSKSVPSSSEGIKRQYIYLISNDYTLASKNKIYELSGWAAAENVPKNGTLLHNAWKVKIFYYMSNGGAAPALGNVPTEATAVTPFAGKTGNQEWTYFNTKPIVNDGLANAYRLYFQAAIDGGKYVTDGGWQGDILLYGLSLHEVEYDELVFTDENSSSSMVMCVGQSAGTVVKHLTTTGNEISTRLTDTNAVADGIAVSYSSSDEAVATVSDIGVITAHSEGCVDITATATINGVTKSRSITLAVNSGEEAESFGACYAYISSRAESECTVTVFAGIESLSYDKVGFEITASATARSDVGITDVYKSVNVKYTSGGNEKLSSVSAKELGMDEDAYIFFRSEKMDLEYADKGLVVRAYAECEDGTRIYGSYAVLDEI